MTTTTEVALSNFASALDALKPKVKELEALVARTSESTLELSTKLDRSYGLLKGKSFLDAHTIKIIRKDIQNVYKAVLNVIDFKGDGGGVPLEKVVQDFSVDLVATASKVLDEWNAYEGALFDDFHRSAELFADDISSIESHENQVRHVSIRSLKIVARAKIAAQLSRFGEVGSIARHLVELSKDVNTVVNGATYDDNYFERDSMQHISRNWVRNSAGLVETWRKYELAAFASD